MGTSPVVDTYATNWLRLESTKKSLNMTYNQNLIRNMYKIHTSSEFPVMRENVEKGPPVVVVQCPHPHWEGCVNVKNAGDDVGCVCGACGAGVGVNAHGWRFYYRGQSTRPIVFLYAIPCR